MLQVQDHGPCAIALLASGEEAVLVGAVMPTFAIRPLVSPAGTALVMHYIMEFCH